MPLPPPVTRTTFPFMSICVPPEFERVADIVCPKSARMR